MAGLQTIIDKCSSITINRRKMVGIQFTRNEIPRVSQTPTRNPWRFTLEMSNRLQYYNNRDLLETMDTIDRISPQVITFSNNPCLSWIFAYQGQLNQTQINSIVVHSFIGNQLILNVTGVAPTSNTIMFEPNDLIQVGAHAYPFTSTTQILRGSGNFVTVTTNRPNIISQNVVGAGLTVGNACDFTVFCPNMPTYKLIPGGYAGINNTTVNNALIEFSDNFDLYEYVGTA